MTADNKKTIGKQKQFIRLLISYNDFENAYDIASIILDGNYHDQIEKLEGKKMKILRTNLRALNCAMIIAYNRPFSGNDKSNKNPIPDLPKGVLKVFNENERLLHSSLIDNRNKIIAHSDSDAIDMEPYYIQVDETKIDLLIPLQNNTNAIYSLGAVEEIKAMCEKLMVEVVNRKFKLEEELQDIIPIKIYGKDEFDFPFNQ